VAALHKMDALNNSLCLRSHFPVWTTRNKILLQHKTRIRIFTCRFIFNVSQSGNDLTNKLNFLSASLTNVCERGLER